MCARPQLNINLSPKDVQNYYWLKEVLIYFCRSIVINKTDAKLK